MFAVVYSYEARDPQDFESHYGPEGEWTTFFARGRGFVGAELLRDTEFPGRYVLIDRWETREAFEAFAAEHRDEYVQRAGDSELYYLQELRLGSFESVW
jgi:heme-degrading monooxygenase HmoA